MNLVTISTYRIGHSHAKTVTVSFNQDNDETVDTSTNGQTSAWVWLPSVAGVIMAMGSIFIVVFILMMIKIRNQNSHNKAPENRSFIVWNTFQHFVQKVHVSYFIKYYVNQTMCYQNYTLLFDKLK